MQVLRRTGHTAEGAALFRPTLAGVDKARVAPALPAGVPERCERFSICDICERVF